MVECVNFMAERGHETHAFARDWEVESIDARVIRHQVDFRTSIAALEPPAYLRASRRVIDSMKPPTDVTASFGIAGPPGSVVWMQSVHAAWIQISRETRSRSGRVKQRLNPFHPVVLSMERRQLKGREYRRLIALTEQVKLDIQHHYGVPAGDIDVLPNGFSGREFRIRDEQFRSDMRRRLGYGTDHKVIVFVANELERKGFTPLAQAVAQLADPSVRLLAIGKFSQRDAHAIAHRFGVADQVKFTGPTSEVADYYAASDIFALPTKYEAWGLVIVEAMACGLPVLTSRLAGAAVTVRDGTNGLLLDEPTDVDEIATGLRSLLDGRHGTPTDIAYSVQTYEWAHLLLEYERILAECRR